MRSNPLRSVLLRPVVLVSLVFAASACDSVNVGPADNGIDYTFTNRCDITIAVELATGSRLIELAVNESYTMRTLDEVPEETFIVTSPARAGESRVTPGVDEFDISGDDCPV